MQNRQGNYEKTILIISSLLAIGVAVFLILQSQGLEESLILPQGFSKNDLNAPASQKVVDATETMKKKYSWVSPLRNGKAVPLNKSVMLVMKDSKLFDLLLPEPKLREPMTNIFLTGDPSKSPPEAPLPNIFSPNVGDLDADSDGFSNLEEFNGKTDPRDASSLPPHTNKLFLIKRISHDYILQLKGGSDGTFQIKRLAPTVSSVFKPLNEEFGFDKGTLRFKILSAEKKTITTKFGPKDAFALKMYDMSTKKEFTLEEGTDVNLAEYEAEFEFRWKKRRVIPGLKEGGTFQLPGLGKSYYILKLEENKAVISPLGADGKPTKETIEIKQG
ncbi:Amuc_1099 family pilus-like system protein [Prosthecobacter fluviatilis]|uniref:Amuc_1099 family pilus-like system protein n=1 Tax=Prosthecobacter fluviatilis TaxID=445931 RepID=A0ABW0KNM2_9BACT